MRRNDNRVKPKPWELIDGVFYPYVEIPIESGITTVVGANESGKSHLLSAIKKAITGKFIERLDFCRYSPLFTVRKNELKYPDFGTQWSNFSDDEREIIRKLVRATESLSLQEISLFRVNKSELILYTPDPGNPTGYATFSLKDESEKKAIESLLPTILEIDSKVALPSSVPIKLLAELDSVKKWKSLSEFPEEIDMLDGKQGAKPTSGLFEILERNYRLQIIQDLDKFGSFSDFVNGVPAFSDSKQEQINDPKVIQVLKSIHSTLGRSQDIYSENIEGYRLAHKLICTIGQVDPDALVDLAQAIEEGKQGYANGIIDKINHQLSTNLNFPSYWVQDTNFSLRVMARDHDLVFTITDRTGTEYSFEERSQGLRYFLSYYIQYRSHESNPNISEILLMDEPDAYLSSQAQQDLLKIFDSFANPEPSSHLSRSMQVVYVTHSPFLIDKNHGERIRVLQKGNEDEGTRVVEDVSKNHYEPLRSSIGAFVGETAFIGNCNLMVEGISDQILLAGAIKYLRAVNAPKYENLDLNHLTIVPSGSASHIPYLVYLARGRDVEQPAVIVLLDGDDAGRDAKKQLQGKGGRYKRPVLSSEFILQVSDIKDLCHLAIESTANVETEDLIPLPICIQATKDYFQDFLGIDQSELQFLTEDLVVEESNSSTVLKALENALTKKGKGDIKITKLGFARHVISVVNSWMNSNNIEEKEAVSQFQENFRRLFIKLGEMQRKAQQRLKGEKLSDKIERCKNDFLASHPTCARREDGFLLLETLENVLDGFTDKASQKEIVATRESIQNLRETYQLRTDATRVIDDFDGFKKSLERIRYAGLLSSQPSDLINHESEAAGEKIMQASEVEDHTDLQESAILENLQVPRKNSGKGDPKT